MEGSDNWIKRLLPKACRGISSKVPLIEKRICIFENQLEPNSERTEVKTWRYVHTWNKEAGELVEKWIEAILEVHWRARPHN